MCRYSPSHGEFSSCDETGPDTSESREPEKFRTKIKAAAPVGLQTVITTAPISSSLDGNPKRHFSVGRRMRPQLPARHTAVNAHGLRGSDGGANAAAAATVCCHNSGSTAIWTGSESRLSSQAPAAAPSAAQTVRWTFTFRREGNQLQL